ncbi:unnamed protein product [Amoebophrya sp. A25]|nr:unnamed protein product [Amoebophrya sp. A25]|eukprot:GSA25T00025920001.1
MELEGEEHPVFADSFANERQQRDFFTGKTSISSRRRTTTNTSPRTPSSSTVPTTSDEERQGTTTKKAPLSMIRRDRAASAAVYEQQVGRSLPFVWFLNAKWSEELSDKVAGMTLEWFAIRVEEEDGTEHIKRGEKTTRGDKDNKISKVEEEVVDLESVVRSASGSTSPSTTSSPASDKVRIHLESVEYESADIENDPEPDLVKISIQSAQSASSKTETQQSSTRSSTSRSIFAVDFAERLLSKILEQTWLPPKLASEAGPGSTEFMVDQTRGRKNNIVYHTCDKDNIKTSTGTGASTSTSTSAEAKGNPHSSCDVWINLQALRLEHSHWRKAQRAEMLELAEKKSRPGAFEFNSAIAPPGSGPPVPASSISAAREANNISPTPPSQSTTLSSTISPLDEARLLGPPPKSFELVPSLMQLCWQGCSELAMGNGRNSCRCLHVDEVDLEVEESVESKKMGEKGVPLSATRKRKTRPSKKIRSCSLFNRCRGARPCFSSANKKSEVETTTGETNEQTGVEDEKPPPQQEVSVRELALSSLRSTDVSTLNPEDYAHLASDAEKAELLSIFGRNPLQGFGNVRPHRDTAHFVRCATAEFGDTVLAWPKKELQG